MVENDQKIIPSKKRIIIWRIARFLGVFILITTLLLILSVFLLDNYLQSNKAKIFEQLTFLNKGSISFEEAQISIYKNFPAATISLQNISVKDSLFDSHQIPFLQADEFRGELSLKKLWEQEVEIKSIEFHKGQINFHTDSTGYNLFRSLISKPQKVDLPKKDSWSKGFKVFSDQLNVSLFNVAIHLSDFRKTSSIQGVAEHLKANLHIDSTGFSADIDMQIAMQEMSFKKDKGAFLQNSKLIGEPKIRFQKGILTFEPFELQINDEHFTFNGIYDTKKKSVSKLVLENKSTRFEKVLPILANSIQKPLTPYLIESPFYSKTVIKFRKGDPVKVDIDFSMVQNKVTVFNNDLNEVDLKGHFVNRIFDSKNDQDGRKGITLEGRNLDAFHRGFELQSREFVITAIPKNAPYLVGDLQVGGKAKEISNWLSNNQFFFNEGRFDLSAQLDGPMNNFNQFMIKSNASVVLEDITVYYKPADVIFPFQRIEFLKNSGEADFHISSSTPSRGHDFQLVGLLKNLPALLIKLKDQRAKSKAEFVADKITWRDFMDWFGKKGISRKGKIETKTDGQKKKTMKQTINGFQHKFQPQIVLNIDTLSYYDLLQLDNVLTNVYFEDEHFLVLEKTSFDYDKGNVDFNARLDIRDSLKTPFEFELRTHNLNLEKLLPPLDYFNIQFLANLEKLPEDLDLIIKHQGIIDDKTGLIPNTSTGEISFDIKGGEILTGEIRYEPELELMGDTVLNKAFTNAKIHLEGDPIVFNSFLKTEQFFFSKGRFFLNFDYHDNPANLEQILNKGNGMLKIRNSIVHYEPTGVDFPLTRVDLILNSDDADFNLFLRSDSLQQEIELQGVINNISELVIGNTGKAIKTTVDVTAPKLIWDQFFYLFVPPKPKSEPKKEQDLNALRTTINGVFDTFDPAIKVKADTFIFTDKFLVTDFATGVHMTDSNNLVLDKIAFNFHDGSMSVNGQFDFNSPGPLPFIANFHTKDLDAEKLLTSMDYFALPSLQSIEELSGRINMNLDLTGLIAEDGKSLVTQSMKGILDFQLNDVVLSGMAPLDSLTRKIRKEKRFAKLRFASIENRITIDGEQIEIPLMEIQSNAINLFLEGTLSYGNHTNIWVSIPLDNLKKADRSIVPKKRGYAASKKKLYFEVTSDEAGHNKFKIRWFKRKFYKSRGIMSKYRKDKRKYRKKRKELKRQNRN